MTRYRLGPVWLSLLPGLMFLTMAETSFGKPGKRDTSANPVGATREACRTGGFARFFRLYVQSPVVRQQFTADQVWSVPAAGKSDFVSRSEFLDRFPLALHGWNYAIAGAEPAGEARRYALIRTGHPSRTVWHVEWSEARFDATSDDGKWIGVPVELTGVPGHLTFVATDDGCWHLTDEVSAPKDTPFQPGVQSLHCNVRADDYRRELRRIESRLDDHPDDMDIGRDLAACAKLQDMIETTIRADAELTGLHRAIKRRLTALGTRQSPAARQALALDEQRFRRSLMRDQYVLMDGSADNRDLRDGLATWLGSRVEILARTEPRRNNFAGVWRKVGGQIDIRRLEDGSFEVDANVVDPDFLAWSCEFNETMLRRGNILSLTYPRGDALRLTLRDGILIVEQDDAGSDYCGAGGNLKGTYFPTRPGPELPPQNPIF